MFRLNRSCFAMTGVSPGGDQQVPKATSLNSRVGHFPKVMGPGNQRMTGLWPVGSGESLQCRIFQSPSTATKTAVSRVS